MEQGFQPPVGFSRAQTVQILSNSLVLELVVLCMQYVEETEEEEQGTAAIEVDIVEVIVAGTFAALLYIPAMLVFAAAFHPQIISNLLRWLVVLYGGGARPRRGGQPLAPPTACLMERLFMVVNVRHLQGDGVPHGMFFSQYLWGL